MVLGADIRRKILLLRLQKKMSFYRIAQSVGKYDNFPLSPSTVRNWIQKQQCMGEEFVLSNTRPTKRRGVKVQQHHLDILDKKIREEPERSSTDLQKAMAAENVNISCSYIRKLRRDLGWICKRTKYGQLVRDTNREKRCKWALEQIANGENRPRSRGLLCDLTLVTIRPTLVFPVVWMLSGPTVTCVIIMKLFSSANNGSLAKIDFNTLASFFTMTFPAQ